MKRIIVASVIFLSGALWWNFSSQKPTVAVEESAPAESAHSQASGDVILKNDYAQLTKNLNSSVTSTSEWNQIISYQTEPKKIISKANSGSYFEAVTKTLPDLFLCLKKDFCGMTTRGEEDPYFDEERTPAHILLTRHLKILSEVLRTDPSLISKLNWELVSELASYDSQLIQVEALELLRQFNPSGINTSELIKVSENYSGEAKAQALVNLTKNRDSVTLSLVSNEIEKIFASSDANTVISVLENLKKMSLGAANISRALGYLCHFKSEESLDHNWSMMKYEAKLLNQNLESFCQ